MTLDQLPECWQPAVTAEIARRAQRRRRDAKRRAIAANRKAKAAVIALAIVKRLSYEDVKALVEGSSTKTLELVEPMLRSREIDALSRVLPRRDSQGRFRCD